MGRRFVRRKPEARICPGRGRDSLRPFCRRQGLQGKKPFQVALDSGVQLEFILDDTTEGASPAADDTVNVNYTLTLMNGNVMDQGENVDFNLQSLIPGFTEAVMHMTVGDTVRAYIPPELGYGETGTPTIEPNSLLIFEITLNSIVPPAESAE